MTKGFVEEDMMKHYRLMVVELNDNLELITLTSDRERVKRYIRCKRKFTNAEADTIADLHYGLLERLKKDGNEQI